MRVKGNDSIITGDNMLRERTLSIIMSVLSRHPTATRLLLGPIANAPVLSRFLHVLPRAFMGATAFEIHDVDMKGGRISLGRVDEVIFSSKFLKLFHDEIAARTGEDEKNRILYDIGRQGGYWEVDQALKHGRWAPKVLADLIENGATLDAIRTSPTMARFFAETMRMVLRLIINEGGWGFVDELEFHTSPMKTVIANSQEAKWMGPSKSPVCYIAAGVMAGYSSRILGEDVTAREVACKAMGAPKCVFEIDR